MPWKTSTGRTLEYPHALLAKYARSQKLTKDQVSELLYQIGKIHEANLELDSMVITLRQDNLRLQHENEFMLRLVNQRDNEQSHPCDLNKPTISIYKVQLSIAYDTPL